MADASDSRSAPSAQRQNPQLPLLHDAASGGVVSAGRRNLLGALALTPIAGAAAASATEPVDPHLGWLAEFYAERLRCDARGADGDDNVYMACHAIEDRILGAEPTTMAGVAAQLMVIAETQHIGLCFDGGTTRPVLQRAAALLPVPTWYDSTVEAAAL